MANGKVIRINLASNILGDFNADILECFICGNARNVVQKVMDYSRMSTFTQRAYKTAIILSAAVMREQLAAYYDVVTYLIGREQCIGFMSQEKLDRLLDSILNCDYAQFKLGYVPEYYDRWTMKNKLSPDEMKNLRRWFMRLAKIRRDYQARGCIAYPEWSEVRW